MAMTGYGMRRHVKTGLAVGAHWSRLDRVMAARRGLDRAPLVVGYHRVVQDFERSSRDAMPSLLVSTKTLEAHLDWIGRRYRFVSLDELPAVPFPNGHGNGVVKGGKPAAVVTFDDGYRDVYENALPLLERKGIPFTVYVVTDLVGTERLQLHDELYLLIAAALTLESGARGECWKALSQGRDGESDRLAGLFEAVERRSDAYRATRLILHRLSAKEVRGVVTRLRSRVPLDDRRARDLLSVDWTMLREMQKRGVTVGSHTRSHALLASCSDAVVREELEGSRELLERRLGVPIRHLAYPDGSFNEKTLEAVQAAGYVTATTTRSHWSEPFPALSIPRRLLWEGACMDGFGRFSSALLSCQVNGVFDGWRRYSDEH